MSAYLNIDKVIKIIRNEDEPKPLLIKAFKLSDVQADAILNMRLRNLRKLEEMGIKNEDEVRSERGLQRVARLGKSTVGQSGGRDKAAAHETGSNDCAWKAAHQLRSASEHDDSQAIEEALAVREPITIVVSEKGWIRALRGIVADSPGLASSQMTA